MYTVWVIQEIQQLEQSGGANQTNAKFIYWSVLKLIELGMEPAASLHAPATQQMYCIVFHGVFIDAIMLFNIIPRPKDMDITIKCAEFYLFSLFNSKIYSMSPGTMHFM